MAVLIPLWFLRLDTIIYAFATIITSLLSLYSFRLFNITFAYKKIHILLYGAFSLLAVAFFILTAASALSYADSAYCINCPLNIPSQTFTVEDFGYMLYFFFSAIAYILFIQMYSKVTSLKELGAVFILPISMLFQPLHFIMLVIISFVAVRSIQNYSADKNEFTFLVMSGFLFLTLYHLSLAFNPFSELFYAIGHIFLLIGLISFLIMVERAGRPQKSRLKKK